MKSTILITGCAGLLGSHLSRHLLEMGYKVIGLDNLFGGYKDFLPHHENFRFYEIDITDYKGVKNIFNEYKPSVCYHFAAYAAEGLSPFIRQFNYSNNVLASMSIINSCIENDCKLIFTSSMAVYGESQPPFIETMKQMPIDPYGIAKYSVEQDIILANKQFGLRYNIVRPHNVIGIYQNIWDRYRNVIGIFIRRVINGQPLLIYGDGEQTRAFSDIKYYMEPFTKLIDGFDGELFNIGADKYWKIKDVANIVLDTYHNITGKFGTLEYKEPRHEVKHAFCDHTKAKTMLNFKDDTKIEHLIYKMMQWALEQPDRIVKNIDYEIIKDIYEYWK